jgi:AraC-like DNA-binding protein
MSRPHTHLEALGRRAGFRSRSAFYEAFRRLLGVTPSLYRRQRASAG